MDHGHWQWFSHTITMATFPGVRVCTHFGSSVSWGWVWQLCQSWAQYQSWWWSKSMPKAVVRRQVLRPDSGRSNVLAAENCEVRRTADVGGKDWISQCQKVVDEQWITRGELDLWDVRWHSQSWDVCFCSSPGACEQCLGFRYQCYQKRAAWQKLIPQQDFIYIFVPFFI